MQGNVTFFGSPAELDVQAIYRFFASHVIMLLGLKIYGENQPETIVVAVVANEAWKKNLD